MSDFKHEHPRRRNRSTGSLLMAPHRRMAAALVTWWVLARTCGGDSLPAGLSRWISPFFFLHVSFSACRATEKATNIQDRRRLFTSASERKPESYFVNTFHLNDSVSSKVTVSVTHKEHIVFVFCHMQNIPRM